MEGWWGGKADQSPEAASVSAHCVPQGLPLTSPTAKPPAALQQGLDQDVAEQNGCSLSLHLRGVAE